MPINLESTTDSKEAVAAALGDLAKEGGAGKSASDDKDQSDESAKESEALEAKDGKEDLEAKEGDKGDDEKDEQAEKPKKKGGFQKRIDKLTKRLSDQEREIEYLRRQSLERSEAKGDESTKKVSADAKPKAEEFETHEEYVEALTDWKMEAKLKAHEEKQREVRVKSEHEARVSEHFKRVEAFKKDHEDFDEVIEEVSDVALPLAVQEIIIASDNGPELLYELAKDTDALERICKLPAFLAAKEIGRFETSLAKSSEGKIEVKKPKAPKPITPVGEGSGGSGKKSIYDQDLSQSEYERLRAEQLKAKGA